MLCHGKDVHTLSFRDTVYIRICNEKKQHGSI